MLFLYFYKKKIERIREEECLLHELIARVYVQKRKL